MGLAERKEREKLELKTAILESAKKILLAQGEEGLSIRKIAQDIEYSPTTIYLYFQDKDEILHELMEYGFVLMHQYMQSAFATADPVQRTYKIGQAYIHFALDNKDWYELMFNSAKPMHHIEKCCEEWDSGQQLFQFLVKTCAEAIEQIGNKQLDPQIIALQLWSNVHGLVNLAMTDRLEIVQRDSAEELIKRTLDSVLLTVFRK